MRGASFRVSAKVALVLLTLTASALTIATVRTLGQAGTPILRYDPTLLLVAAPPVATDTGGQRTRDAPVVDPDWIAAVASAAGIPQPALRAYTVAAARTAASDPGCRLGWTTLAGIGYIESQHGQIGDRTLLADGRSDPLILGPALDGKGDVAAIAATAESTQWHGDPVWDHAVGPLQFLPSTWASWRADGDGDGVRDPNDIDDAAFAAARYLCADGHVLDAAGWSAAIFSYNHADSYVRAVYDAASAYASRAAEATAR